LRRAIENRVEDPLSEELLRGEFQGKDEIVVEAVWDENHERILRLKFNSRLRPPVVQEAEVGAVAGEQSEDDRSSE